MRFNFHQPDTLEAAIGLLSEHKSDAALLAGGTALLIDMQHGELTPSHLVSLWGVSGLSGVSLNGEGRVGALTTISDLAEAVHGRQQLAGLYEAARMVGGRQIQNMATVGGNICKASPGADMVPPLLGLDAKLTLQGPEGERSVSLEGFLTGPDMTALRPGEILTSIRLPLIPQRTGTAFLKVMRRRAVDCSIVAVAARITLAEDGKTCADARVGVAAAAPKPFRAKTAEGALEGVEIGQDVAQEAGQLAKDESTPIDDVRASAEYRSLLVETLVERAVLTAADRAGGK